MWVATVTNCIAFLFWFWDSVETCLENFEIRYAIFSAQLEYCMGQWLFQCVFPWVILFECKYRGRMILSCVFEFTSHHLPITDNKSVSNSFLTAINYHLWAEWCGFEAWTYLKHQKTKRNIPIWDFIKHTNLTKHATPWINHIKRESHNTGVWWYPQTHEPQE